MKRTEIRVGQEVVLASSPDWKTYKHLTKVTIADTRAFAARSFSYGSKDYGKVTLENGLVVNGGSYCLSPGTGVMVVNENDEVRLVQLGSLRGEYAEIKPQHDARHALKDEMARKDAERKADRKARLQVAVQALRDAGVDMGYVGDYQTDVTIGVHTLEAIVRLISKEI